MSRFARNMGFYFLGTFATKLLQFIFIPIYTKYLSTSDLGIYSIVVVTVSLCIPLLFQSIWEGAFRFTIEAKESGREILATSSKYCFSLAVIYSLIFIVVSYTIDLELAGYILFYAIGQILVSYWQFAARALKENKLYSIASVVNSAIAIFLNILLIVFFNQGVKSLLIANSVGSFVMVAILEFRLRLFRDAFRYKFNRSLLINIIKYSIPLAINTISWWLFSSSNNYVITAFWGSGQTGIYSMAIKFGTILATVTSVITLAWNEEAFRTFGEENQYIQFNSVLNNMIKTLLSAVLVLVPVTYVAYKYFVFGDFKAGAALTPLIYLGAIFNTLACHLGSIFLARKESARLFLTTLSGGVVAVILSIAMVGYIGILGAAIASLIGYMVNFVIRIPMIKKRIKLQISYNWLIILTVIILMEGLLCEYYKDSIIILLVLMVLTSGFALIMNKALLFGIIKKVVKRK